MIRLKKFWLFNIASGLALCILLAVTSSAGDCGGQKSWNDIYLLPTNGSPESNIRIELSLDKTCVVTKETVTISFQADKDCYLTLMSLGPSGRILRLWPNDYSGQDNFIRAGVRRQFPSAEDGFRYKAAPPGGIENIVAYATSEKNKILTESEFAQLKNTGFKQYKGTAKDIDVKFRENVDAAEGKFAWGTAQVNLCIEEPRPEPAQSSSTTTQPPQPPAEQASVPPALPEEGKTHVLAVGVSTEGLKYCEEDARKFNLTVKSSLKVPVGNTRILTGKEVTYEGLRNGLSWLAEKSSPQDTVVVFFSGHGSSIPDQPPLDESDGRDECFVLHHEGKIRDYRLALRQKTIMVDDDFNALLKKIPARKKIVVVDSCHSGTISKGQGLQSGPLVSKYLPLIDPGTGDQMWNLQSKAVPSNYGNDHEAIMSACLDNESSYEDSDKKAGLFTYHLIDAVQKGATDLEVAFRKAKLKIQQEVKYWAGQSGGKLGMQTPSLTDPHGLLKSLQLGR